MSSRLFHVVMRPQLELVGRAAVSALVDFETEAAITGSRKGIVIFIVAVILFLLNEAV